MRLHKRHHAGILLQSASEERIRELVDSYTTRFMANSMPWCPAPEMATA